MRKKVKRASTKKLKDLPAKAKGVRGGSADYYVQFGDIKGEPTDSSHKDWVMTNPGYSNRIMIKKP